RRLAAAPDPDLRGVVVVRPERVLRDDRYIEDEVPDRKHHRSRCSPRSAGMQMPKRTLAATADTIAGAGPRVSLECRRLPMEPATGSVAAATETRRAGARGTGRHDGYRCRL